MINCLKSKKALTLLEVTIALGVFSILSLGVMFIFYNTSNATGQLIQRQNYFEQSRRTVELLEINLQMATEIVLTTDENNILTTLTLTQRNPSGNLENYEFHFIDHLQIFTIGLRSPANEFARNISSIKIYPNQNKSYLYIHVTSSCETIVLQVSVDIRYKAFNSLP